MDATHIHLILNHFPIIGLLFGTVFLGYALFAQSKVLKEAALVIFIITALVSVPVFLTGEEAEHKVEDFSNVSEHMIEEHEEHAEISIWAIEILGVLSLVGLYFSNKGDERKAKKLIIVALIFSFFVFVNLAITGYYGGKISHQELRESENIEHHEEH
jgi:uncharacterized membrane protein